MEELETRIETTGPTILVVGQREQWLAENGAMPDLKGFHFCGYEDLDGEILAAAGPEIVLSPLFGAGFDALDLAKRLSSLGFVGRYRALSANLPRTDLVRGEVRAAAPEIDFDILTADSLLNL